MARPQVTRREQRVQVAAPQAQTQYDVTQQMHNVDTGPSAEVQSWEALQRNLGVVAQAHRQYKAEKKEGEAEAYAQGTADAKFGKVDAERAKKEQKYADGVERAHVTTATADAISKIEERAQTELPANLSTEEKLHWVDQQLQAELGPLVAESPHARRIVAEQYQDYVERFAGREMAANREQHQTEMHSAYEITVSRAIAGGKVDIDQLIDDGAAVYGTREAAAGVYVEMVAQRAEEQNDDTILDDLLPAKLTYADGTSVDAPFQTNAAKARVATARERIRRFKYDQEAPKREWIEAQYIRPFEDMANEGFPLTLAHFQEGINKGVVTSAKANDLINRAAQEREKRGKKELKFVNGQRMLAVYGAQGSESYLDVVGVADPDGNVVVENKQDAQDLTDETFRRTVVGFTVANGGKAEGAPVSGAALADPSMAPLRQQLFADSVKRRLPWTPLKSYMSDINPAMGKTVVDRLPFYQEAKAAGVEHLYVDDDTAAVYESALKIAGAGETPEQTIQSIQKMADPAVRKYAEEHRGKALKLALQGEFKNSNAFFDANTKDVANLPFVQAKIASLVEVGLSRGMDETHAANFAHERFANTHFAVKVNGSSFMVPQVPGMDSGSVAFALEEFGNQASAMARQRNDPNPESATLAVSFGRNGRGIEVYVIGSDGRELNTKPILLEHVIAQGKQKDPLGFAAAAAANRKYQDELKARNKALVDKAQGRDIRIQPKL